MHVWGVPKKTFQCPIKMSLKVVCLVVLFLNVIFLFGRVEHIYGTEERFFNTQNGKQRVLEKIYHAIVKMISY